MKNIKLIKIGALLVIFANISFLWAQSASLTAANKRTAERCLSLAENYIISNDWQNALNQAELGLAYDDSISDLIYVKAAALSSLGNTRAVVLETIKEAFVRNNWVNYNKNSARILYADLLSDTGNYEQSLDVLNQEQFLYSADAEFIRIKDYYRIGTQDSINMARDKLNSSRKIYPTDERFPKLFFMFESLYMIYSQRNGEIYEIPDQVKNIADAYVVKFPDYSKTDVEMEVMALLFADKEQRDRLLKAIGEINQENPLFAIAALETGVASEERAYNIFIRSSSNNYNLYYLEVFGSLLKDYELKDNFSKFLNSFSGTLYIDENLDLLNELVIDYERGRPSYIHYDKNNDEVIDLYSPCDFGTPLSVSFDRNKTDLFYDIYPAVNKVIINSNNSVFHFLDDDYAYDPFDVVVDKIFAAYGVYFYIPCIKNDFIIPDEYELIKYASAVEIPTEERENSKVIYTIYEGRPVFASFSNGSQKYAYCTIEPGCPFVRYADYDNDNIYETAETYDADALMEYSNDEDEALIQKVFGRNTFSKLLYLKKVEIDRNSDTLCEYREEFLPKNGRICSWDNDSNGIIDYQYICYPSDDSGIIKELNVFYNTNGIEYIAISQENKKPVSIKFNGKEVPVIKGEKDNYYWIEAKGTLSQEVVIEQSMGRNIENGLVQLIGIDDNLRIAVIKVDGLYFCRILPPGEIIENAEYANE